ncbi:FAD-binding oxidoreductase [Candidatus Leptofilum sp.]|uniref:FAD-binding oxidoreductase n=1 Tax=Candidatus Leptofilum sp. TaxID=3241576 RepID=UPI003B5A90B1
MMNKQASSLKEYMKDAFSNGTKPDLSWIDELKALIGADAVLVDEETIDLHSYDAWPVAAKWKNQGKRPFAPDVVVQAHSAEQVSKLLQWANEKNVPVTPWGGGSSVTGQGLPSKGGIVLDTMSMDKVIALSDESLMVKVQAGKYGHRLEEELNARGYTLNHSPQSLDRSTVGGWVATRAMGQFSSRYGGIEDLIVAFTVVLPTGEIVETMNVPRGAVGPDLRHIFVGAEGTMGVVTDVTVKIFPIAEFRLFEAVTFDSVEAGVTVMRQTMRQGLKPFLVRFYDVVEARHAMQDKTFEKCVMFLGFEGVETVAMAEYTAVMDICAAQGGEKIGPAPVEAWMDRRFDFSTVENILAENGGLAETIEIAHFWDGILETYYELKEALAPYAAEVLGHFSHVYPQGTSLYVILLGKDTDDATAEANLLEIWDVAMRICVKNGAAISHHHGSGLARLPYVQDALGSSMPVLQKVKAALDPNDIMNPGKLGL